MAEENNIVPDGRKPGSASGPEPSPESDPPATDAAAPRTAQISAAETQALTPGQRLAQKRGKKALQKKELRAELQREEAAQADAEQQEAERLLGMRRDPVAPDAVQEVAGEFTGYVQHNRGRIVGLVVGVLALGFAVVLGRGYFATGSAEQAQLLASAAEIAKAPVDVANAEGKNEDGKPVFKSASDRATKAAQAFASAAAKAPDSLAASWAKLGQASVLLTADKAAQAVALFQSTLTARKDDPMLSGRALEGLGIALEATGKTDEAQKRFEELKSHEGGARKDVAEYHLARLKLAKGDREGAKVLLKEVYDRLGAPAEGAPRSRFLKGEVEARLAELDSSLVPAGGSEAQQFSSEEIQRLIQQLQQKGNAPPGGAGE